MSRPSERARAAAAWLCLAVSSLACTPSDLDRASGLDTGFPLAYSYQDCAPWDGLALAILLSHEPVENPFEARFPSLRVTSFRPPAPLAGGAFSWSGDAHDLGQATWCEDAGACSSPESVQVRFHREQPSSNRLLGEVRVDLGGGRVVAGGFDALQLSHQALCG